MQDEIEEKSKIIEQLKADIEKKQREFDEIQLTLREAIHEGKSLDNCIDDREKVILKLEGQLKRNNPSLKGKPRKSKTTAGPRPNEPSIGDEIDKLFNKHIQANECEIPVKKVGGGYYMFGTKKVYSKIMNGKLVIRVGGGYMVVDEFIQTYGELEMIKIQAMKGASGDLIQEENSISFSKKKNLSLKRKSKSPKKRITSQISLEESEPIFKK